jgi:hypothetical protein
LLLDPDPCLLRLDHRTGAMTFAEGCRWIPHYRVVAPIECIASGYVVRDAQGAVVERHVRPLAEGRAPRPPGGFVQHGQPGPRKVASLLLASIAEPSFAMRYDAFGGNAQDGVRRLIDAVVDHAETPAGLADFVNPVITVCPDSIRNSHGDLFFFGFDVVDWLHRDGRRLLSKDPVLGPDALVPRGPSRAPVPTFAEVAERLEANGYRPVAEVGTSRAPARKGWLRARPAAVWLRATRRSRSLLYTGLLTARTPAVDLDVTDPDLAGALERLAVGMLGRGLRRVGQPPKVALLYRATEAFDTRSLAFRLGARDHLVEVLADRRKVTAIALHWKTRKPYAWPDGSPLDVPRRDLPELDVGRAEAFLDAVATVIKGRGGEVTARARPRTACGPHGPMSPADAGRLADALARIPNDDLPYPCWIKIGLILKHELGEEGGEPLWLWWSSQSAKDDPSLTSETWLTLQPDGRVTAGSLFHIAKHGWQS